MKKIFMIFSTGAMISAAVILGGCNNAEEVKKQQDAENANIQSLVDGKLNGLQADVDKECQAMVDSAANAQFTEWQAEQKHKGGAKPKPKKQEPKKEPGKIDVGKKGGNGGTPQKIDVGTKGGNSGTPQKINIGKKGGGN